jgi:hypothetical protein
MIGESAQTITLGKQLGAAGGIMVFMTVLHTLGLTTILRVLDLQNDHLEQANFDLGSVLKMSAMGVMLIVLHTIEIAFFALFYLWVDGVDTLEKALFYSASAYATLGWTADYFPSQWRLIGAFEALIGFLLIGWSTAFIATKASKLMPD